MVTKMVRRFGSGLYFYGWKLCFTLSFILALEGLALGGKSASDKNYDATKRTRGKNRGVVSENEGRRRGGKTVAEGRSDLLGVDRNAATHERDGAGRDLDPRRTACGICVWEDCPSVDDMKRHCPAGVVRDNCNCCVTCATGLRRPCHVTPIGLLPPCGTDLECVAAQETSETNNEDENIGECACTQDAAVCATGNRTFENICQFREVASRRPDLTRFVHGGPCRTVPHIKFPPTDIISDVGTIASYRCEVIGFPLPEVRWKRKLRSSVDDAEEVLPGFNGNIITQIRGGPAKYQLTTWLTVDSVTSYDIGYYVCEASNEVGVVRSDATLAVN